MHQTIVIKKASKLQYSVGYITIYDGEDEKKVFINDVSMLIIESTNTVLTVPLLNELVNHNVALIICNEKHNPHASIIGLNSHYQASGNLFKQLEWDNDIKGLVWQQIVIAKIKSQNNILIKLKSISDSILNKYVNEVMFNDTTNREGLAAKVYFSLLFENNFNRNDASYINSILDYGYSMLLSCFNRGIVESGYNPQIGIWHKGKTNPYNLGCDFMEPFRPIVDMLAYLHRYSKEPIKDIRKMLSYKIIIDGEERYIDDAINVYVKALVKVLNKESDIIPEIDIKEIDYYGVDKSRENNS